MKPVWWVFTGMGSQWPAMGSELMKIPVFADSIQRSHEVLKSKGLDLLHIITTTDPKIFDNILHSFVGIAAIQVKFSFHSTCIPVLIAWQVMI